jgi:hypothetical protein
MDHHDGIGDSVAPTGDVCACGSSALDAGGAICAPALEAVAINSNRAVNTSRRIM